MTSLGRERQMVNGISKLCNVLRYIFFTSPEEKNGTGKEDWFKMGIG